MTKEPKPVRIFIYTADIRNITGKSESYARRLTSLIRKVNKKEDNIPITIFEFCNYMHLRIEQIVPFMQ